MLDRRNDILISVVIPVYNEVESLNSLYTELSRELEKTGQNYEIIFVDDGSTDGSFALLEELYNKDRNIRIIQFPRNFGKSAALTAGFARARGKIIITMDADLQDDPMEIPRFIAEMEKGYALVSGWRVHRRDRISKRLSSRIFNKMTALFTGVKIHDFNCGFKAYQREVAQNVRIYGELHRYIPALAYWRGYRVGEIKVRHHPRKYGRSKFGLERFLRGFFDLATVMFLTHYTRRPLHLFGSWGLCTFFLGLVINIYLSILWFRGFGIGHRPLLILGVLLMIIGVQLIFFGLLAEMIVHSQPGEKEKSLIKKILQ